MRMCRPACLLIAFIAFLIQSGAARAQSSLQIPIQFDFLNPGAKSLALGSAFVGLADDATASFANPAGLVQLELSEFSLEGRYQRAETRYLAGGRLTGTPVGQGIDITGGPIYGTNFDRNFGASFLSYVHSARRWAFAAYRHELVRVDEGFRSQGVFQTDRFGPLRELPTEAARQIEITNYGFAVSHRLGDRVDVGAGVSAYDGKVTSRFSRFTFADYFGPASFSSADEVGRSTQLVDGWAPGFNVGALWFSQSMDRNTYPRAQVGAAYRRGPSFDFSVQEGDLNNQQSASGRFRIPDVLSAGAVLKASQAFLVAVEYSFVRYARLQNDYVTLQARRSGKAAQFDIGDVSQVHVGTEYAFRGGNPAIRAGAWYDPAHAVTYRQTPAADVLDQRFSAYLPGEQNLVHYTFGAGLTLGSRLALHGGADFSKRTRHASASVIVWLR